MGPLQLHKSRPYQFAAGVAIGIDEYRGPIYLRKRVNGFVHLVARRRFFLRQWVLDGQDQVLIVL